MKRYLGIDYGEKRIGVSISDPTFTIAQPLPTIKFANKKKLVSHLRGLISEYDIIKIVVGLPLTLAGVDSARTREVRKFADELQNKLNIDVYLLDERLTSIQAEATIRQMGKQPSRHKEKIDQLAAQYILQTYLDREKNRRENETTP